MKVVFGLCDGEEGVVGSGFAFFCFFPFSSIPLSIEHFFESLAQILPRLLRLNYIFTIGKGAKPWVSLPEGKGIRMTVAEERDKRLAAKS